MGSETVHWRLCGGVNLALHLGLHAALSLKRQLSRVVLYDLLWTLTAKD